MGGGPPPGPALVGRWRSEGADVAPLLAAAPGNLTRLDAEFTADGRFIVAAVNRNGERIDLAGTFSVDERPDPPTIVLLQTAPYEARSEGLWQVDAGGGVLTYEVVDLEFGTPPAAGFGSTNNGQFGEDNIQIYRRLP